MLTPSPGVARSYPIRLTTSGRTPFSILLDVRPLAFFRNLRTLSSLPSRLSHRTFFVPLYIPASLLAGASRRWLVIFPALSYPTSPSLALALFRPRPYHRSTSIPCTPPAALILHQSPP
ncbi:hypothetical protein B0H17DRAFT_1200067 [Mycena rosella]|uniref:Uncharacterized protein n=1 Tax=Mycena rosella TaxID=1033263 RepID=A0AAD7DKH8_MYCRO|nr:hypothetical protein B0H17DRAFT_1200067 [Mycena rosella]